MQTLRPPVKYGRPPVIEVVCGIAFSLSQPLKSAHVGLYWSRVMDEYPRCDDAPPLAMVVEGQGPAEAIGYNLQLQALALPPMRRAWLINAEGTHLLQLQDDRFLFNWKRVEETNTYPSYERVVAGFHQEWARYQEFLNEQGLGTPTPVQLEMTYVNFLQDTDMLCDHQRADSGARFLPKPEAVDWKNLHTLPDSYGRLYVTAQSARHATTGEKGVRLDLTARGLPPDITEAGCQRWFSLAHDWITFGFTDITTPKAHEIWGRTA